MKSTNAFTTLALAIGGLSLTDKITFIIGLVVLIMAGVANWYSFKKHKAEKELAEHRMKKEKDEK